MEASQTNVPDEGVRVPPVLVEAPPAVVAPRAGDAGAAGGRGGRGGVARRASRHSQAFQTRMWSAFILVVAGGVLGVGAWMTPSLKGYGTHAESLGLMPCGFLKSTGIPCPTCGCTTAVSHFARGHVVQAFVTQPFGGAFALLALVMALFAAHGLITGRWRGPQPFTIGWYWRSITLAAVAVLIGGWVYKIYAMKHGW